MAEEDENESEKTTMDDLLDQLEDLKENSVSKAEYNSLKDENKKLVERLATERKPAEQPKEEPTITPQDRYEKLQANADKMVDETLSGMEYAQLLVENHELEEELGIDPFAVDSNPDLRERDTQTYEFLKDALEKCNGDPSLFNHIMESNTIVK